jgi:hypothetical protein
MWINNEEGVPAYRPSRCYKWPQAAIADLNDLLRGGIRYDLARDLVASGLSKQREDRFRPRTPTRFPPFRVEIPHEYVLVNKYRREGGDAT